MALTEYEIETIRGEVEDSDVYRMRFRENIVSINDPNYVHEWGHARGFDFEPDVIFDLGANCGMFSRYCRKLFPKARIVSVEPDNDNLDLFRLLGVPDVLLTGGIGSGKLYRINGAVNGGGESYLSEGLGFTKTELLGRAIETNYEGIKLSHLVNRYVKPGDRFVVKMDMEGAENAIFGDETEMDALRRADYITGELHYYASSNVETVRTVTEAALASLAKTHHVTRNGIFLYAIKK